MEFADGRFWCGLVRTPSEYLDTPAFGDHVLGAIFAQALGVGRGCDSDIPGNVPLAPIPPSVSSRPSSKTLGIGAPKC